MRRLLLLVVLCWCVALPAAAQTAYPYTFTHDRLNTTFYQTCVDSQPCVSVGMPATNTVTFLLTNGTHTIKVQACNANGCSPVTSATGNPITVTVPTTPPPVCPTIILSPTTLTTGTVGTAYSRTLVGGGGTSPYTFRVTTGAVSAGLTLSLAGLLSGTPTTAATSSFTVTATDTATCTGSQAYSLTIACPTITLSPTTLASGIVGTAYSHALSGVGGTGPYTFAVTSGAVPLGTTLSSAGLLSGTPTTAQTASFTVRTTDARGCTGSQPYSVPIVCPTLTLSPTSLATGQVSSAYSQALTGGGGTGPYTFAVTAGSLPAGLTLSSAGLLSGTPTTDQTYTFTIRATDARGCTVSHAYALIIAPIPPVCPTVTLSPTTLPAGTVAVAYSQALSGVGGTGPYTFAVTTGAVPTGLTLSGAGLLSGTVNTAQTATFTVTTTDAGACTGTQAYSLTIACPTVTLSPTSLSSGMVGTAYSQALSGAGGTGPYTFAVTSGTLPAGLTLSGAGLLSGTPTTAQTAAPFTVRATDTHGCAGSLAYTLTIAPIPPPVCPTLTITPAGLANGQAGTSYSQALAGVGGTGPYTFRVTSGVLPAGLALSLAGVLSGTPTAAAVASFTITATDAAACTVGQAYTLTIVAAPPPPVCPTVTISPVSLPAGQVSSAYSQTLLAAGGQIPYGFSVIAGSLPAGLTLTVPGVLSGTPTVAINAPFTVQAADVNTCKGTQAYLLSIAAEPPPPPSGTLLDWEFPTSASPRFSGTSWQGTTGADGALGWMGVTGTLLTDTAFAATSTGTVRVDFYVKVPDGVVQSGTSADFGLMLLPDAVAISASNSAGSITISRSRQAGATAGIAKLKIRSGRKTITLATGISRGAWHKLTILANMNGAKTSQILVDDALAATITWPNSTIVSVSRIGLTSGSNVPLSGVDKLRVVAQ